MLRHVIAVIAHDGDGMVVGGITDQGAGSRGAYFMVWTKLRGQKPLCHRAAADVSGANHEDPVEHAGYSCPAVNGVVSTPVPGLR